MKPFNILEPILKDGSNDRLHGYVLGIVANKFNPWRRTFLTNLLVASRAGTTPAWGALDATNLQY